MVKKRGFQREETGRGDGRLSVSPPRCSSCLAPAAEIQSARPGSTSQEAKAGGKARWEGELGGGVVSPCSRGRDSSSDGAAERAEGERR